MICAGWWDTMYIIICVCFFLFFLLWIGQTERYLILEAQFRLPAACFIYRHRHRYCQPASQYSITKQGPETVHCTAHSRPHPSPVPQPTKQASKAGINTPYYKNLSIQHNTTQHNTIQV